MGGIWGGGGWRRVLGLRSSSPLLRRREGALQLSGPAVSHLQLCQQGEPETELPKNGDWPGPWAGEISLWKLVKSVQHAVEMTGTEGKEGAKK